MNDEQLDYQLHRLKEGKSTCFEPGNWGYMDSEGGLHKLTNRGYYFAWGCDMWSSCYWHKGSWVLGEIGYSKGGLISTIEKQGLAPKWVEGFGKGKLE